MNVAIIGAGPAGLMVADVLSQAGLTIDLYDQMPSPGRKFLMAGRGGLNLTHSEPLWQFQSRYGAASARLSPLLDSYGPEDLVAWCQTLGQPTFVGSSGRVFPKSMKASPLLRAWLTRLKDQHVALHLRHGWKGWDAVGDLQFSTPAGTVSVPRPSATVLALGGASWPRLGSDGGWTTLLAGLGSHIARWQPANCGVTVDWSDLFKSRFAGQPLKAIALSIGEIGLRSEVVVTDHGLEGPGIYELLPQIREQLAIAAAVCMTLDLRPDSRLDDLAARLDRPAVGASLASRLRRDIGLSPLQANLLRESLRGVALPDRAVDLARLIKALPIAVTGTSSLDRAISSAGGLAFDALAPDFSLKALPDVYACGEMLDWEAPTGGYLLQACFTTAVHVARTILQKNAGRADPSGAELDGA